MALMDSDPGCAPVRLSRYDMDGTLREIDTILARIAQLAEDLRADPDGDVRRSAYELRAAFAAREPIEPAVARMRRSVRMLRRGNKDGARREFERRSRGLDYLAHVLEQELMPCLRRIGFEI